MKCWAERTPINEEPENQENNKVRYPVEGSDKETRSLQLQASNYIVLNAEMRKV